MKFVNWLGLAAGIFLGGIFAYLITRFLSLDFGISENSLVFICMFSFGLIGKTIAKSTFTHVPDDDCSK